MQIGFDAVYSNFNGAAFTADSRDQFFVTAGLFRRSYCGWQWGVAWDYLRDDWYYDIDLAQLRGELSWAWLDGSSCGFTFATSVDDDTQTSRLLDDNGNVVTEIESWETRDLYAFFYSVNLNRYRCGQWRLFAGFTGSRDGLIGSDFKLPLHGTWALEPTFTYLIPDEPTGSGGNEEESWNVALNLVWYPGAALHGVNRFYLPMFDVADNGSMIVRRR
jgi:hypothetical protein